jgi:hypothetical protein
VRRGGLGHRGRLEDEAGDPLEGLVNLFDLGIVLALAFLVAGLTVTLSGASPRSAAPAGARPLPATAGAAHASGAGEAVGSVYRLADGQLVYVPQRSGR